MNKTAAAPRTWPLWMVGEVVSFTAMKLKTLAHGNSGDGQGTLVPSLTEAKRSEAPEKTAFMPPPKELQPRRRGRGRRRIP
jgi:hypothetical protein